MESEKQVMLQYIQSLLNDSTIVTTIPDNLKDIDGLLEIDQTIRNLRHSIKTIGNGELSDKLSGRGYLMGSIKSLQATLRNIIWQTKAISSGDFSQKVPFLGEFSEAFNGMAKKIDDNINEVTEARALLELVFKMIPDATMIVSYDGLRIYKCNQAFETITGYSKDDLYNKSLREISFFKDINQEIQYFNSVKEIDCVQNLSLELDIHIDSFFQGLFSSSIIYIEQERYIFSVIKNISELKKLEEKLKASEEIHRLLADNASDVIWVMDLTGKFTYVSPSVKKLSGYSVEEVLNQPRETFLMPESVTYLETELEAAIYNVENELDFKVFRADVEQPCKDGTTVWTDLTVSGIYDKNNLFLGMLGVSRDISVRKNMEEEIIRLTEVDRLTQLSNRLKLDKIIKFEIERSMRSNSSFAVIMLDIDNFKLVNDTYGHIIGDDVLKEVAEIIKNTVRKIDTAGRWGGEEFLIVLPESGINGGYTLAEKLRKNIENHNFNSIKKLSASFGVSQFEKGINEIELVSRADDAMYNAKKTGKNCVCKYSVL